MKTSLFFGVNWCIQPWASNLAFIWICVPCLYQIHLAPCLCDKTIWNLFRSLADILTLVPQKLQGCSPSTPWEVEGPLLGFTANPVLPAIKTSFYFFFSLTTTSFGYLLHPFLGKAPGHGPSLGFYLFCNCCWHIALLTPSWTVNDHHSIPQANLSVNCLKLHCPKSSKYTCCSFQKACRPLF